MTSSAFKTEINEKRRGFGLRKAVEQMRLVALQSGELRHVNDSFADILGLSAEDLKGRNLLDVVLFKNPEELQSDRGLFNQTQATGSGLSGLQSGMHILLLGRNQDPYNFFFDWVENYDGKRYLIASSFKDDKPIEWTHYREEQGVTDPTVQKKNQGQSVSRGLSLDHPINVANDDVSRDRGDSDGSQAVVINAVQSDVLLDVQDVLIFSSLNHDLKCILSSDGSIVRFNETFKARIGVGLDQSVFDCFVEDDRAFVRQYIQSLQRHDAEDGIDQNVIHFDARMTEAVTGKVIWMQWAIHMVQNRLYCIGHDISAAKNNEASLKRREQELSEAQALAHMGHWRWKVGSSHLEWSDQIFCIFGVDPETFVPTLDNTNALLHKRDIGRMMQAFQRAIIEQNDYDIDFRVVRPDGVVAYVRCEGRCELDTDGDVVALYGVMQDITEQTEYEMQLRQAKEQAEQAYASKSRFLANMSHELRTPLNAIIGFSDMIAQQVMGPVGCATYLDYAGNIKESGSHLLALIADILDMSKMEAGKYELDLGDVSLGHTVKSAANMMACRAREGGITIRNEVMSDGPQIYADRRAVMQILLNILSNAVKFTDKGGEITVRIEEFDHHVTVKVSDTGIGIPANKLSSVLLPFEQVSTALTRGHEGSGLGLAITKELAELHGGMIALESTEGVGTTASIRLPRQAIKAIKEI